jgi:hypothetical protein
MAPTGNTRPLLTRGLVIYLGIIAIIVYSVVLFILVHAAYRHTERPLFDSVGFALATFVDVIGSVMLANLIVIAMVVVAEALRYRAGRKIEWLLMMLAIAMIGGNVHNLVANKTFLAIFSLAFWVSWLGLHAREWGRAGSS